MRDRRGGRHQRYEATRFLTPIATVDDARHDGGGRGGRGGGGDGRGAAEKTRPDHYEPSVSYDYQHNSVVNTAPLVYQYDHGRGYDYGYAGYGYGYGGGHPDVAVQQQPPQPQQHQPHHLGLLPTPGPAIFQDPYVRRPPPPPLPSIAAPAHRGRGPRGGPPPLFSFTSVPPQRQDAPRFAQRAPPPDQHHHRGRHDAHARKMPYEKHHRRDWSKPAKSEEFNTQRGNSEENISLKNLSTIAIKRFQAEEPAPKRSRWDMKSLPARCVSSKSSKPKMTGCAPSEQRKSMVSNSLSADNTCARNTSAHSSTTYLPRGNSSSKSVIKPVDSMLYESSQIALPQKKPSVSAPSEEPKSKESSSLGEDTSSAKKTCRPSTEDYRARHGSKPDITPTRTVVSKATNETTHLLKKAPVSARSEPSSRSRESRSLGAEISSGKKSNRPNKEVNLQEGNSGKKFSSKPTVDKPSSRDSRNLKASSRRASSSKTPPEVDGPKKASSKSRTQTRTLSPPKFNTSFKIPKKNLPNPLLESGLKEKTKISVQSWLQKSQMKNPIPIRSALNTSVKPPNIEKLVLCRNSSVWSIDKSKASSKKGNESSSCSELPSSHLEDILEGRTEINLNLEIRAAQLGLRSRSHISSSEINSSLLKSKAASLHSKETGASSCRKPQKSTKNPVERNSQAKSATTKVGVKSSEINSKKRKKRSGFSSDDEWTPRARSRSRTKSKTSASQWSPSGSGVATRTRSRTRSPSAKAANGVGFSCRYSSGSESDEGEEPSTSWNTRNIQDWMDQSTEETSSSRVPVIPSSVPERQILEVTLRDNRRKKEIFVAGQDNYISLQAIVSQRETPDLPSPSMPSLVAYGDISPHGLSSEMPNLMTGSPSVSMSQGLSEESNFPANSPHFLHQSHEAEVTLPTVLSVDQNEEEVSSLASPVLSDELTIEGGSVKENPKSRDFEIIEIDICRNFEGPLDFNLPFTELWAKIEPKLKCYFEKAEDWITLSNNTIKTFISRFNQAEKMITKSVREGQFVKLKQDFITEFTRSWAEAEVALLQLHEDFSDREVFTVLRKKFVLRNDISDIQGVVEDMKHLNYFLKNPKMDKLTRNCGEDVTIVGKLFSMHALKRDYVAASVKGGLVGADPVHRRASPSVEEEIPRTPSRDSGILGDTSPRQDDKNERRSIQEQIECSRCGQGATLKCSACVNIYYCLRACQEAHWLEGHSSQCGSTRQQ